MTAPVLRTDRLLLRPWQEADREPFAAMNADPAVVEFLLGPLTRAESDAMVERIEASFASKGYGLWAVEVIDGPPFLGYVGLWEPRFEAHFTPAVEIGWRLARAGWGHGYASEGARAALTYAFASLGLPEVVSFTAATNLRSRAVMERLGMVRNPSEDFEHPLVPADSPLRRHVLYRAQSSAATWTARASHQAHSSS